MKGLEKCFPVVQSGSKLFQLLSWMESLLKCDHSKVSVDEMLKYDHSWQMNATEQYFFVVLFIVLNKVVLTFESMGEILKRGHSNETS